MNHRLIVCGAVVLCAGAVAYHAATNATPVSAQVEPPVEEVPVAARASEPAPALVAATPEQADGEPELPPEFFRKLPPSSRVPMTLPTGFTSGLRCPDGSYLPLLNGVTEAYPINRDVSIHGPLPPVVAKRTDSGGYEWYEHADGTLTTVRMTPVTKLGVTAEEPVTSHVVPVDPGHMLPPPVGPRKGAGSLAGMKR